LFCRAAKAGSGLADLEIGALYERGFTLPNIYTPDMIYSNSWGGDKDMALKWYLRAADRGNSAGMYLAGYFYRFGTRMTGYHHPVEFLKALPLMERAASLGDVEAMLALLTIYGDGGESPNPRLATETRERLRHRIAEVQSKCVRKNSEIRALMPERQIKGLIFGLAHSSSYSCIAVFEGEEEGDSLAEELAYVAQAKMFPGWTFTVFSNDDRSFEKVTAASAGEQIEKYATEVAIIISAVKAIQQP
jgi:TPR repeat protein